MQAHPIFSEFTRYTGSLNDDMLHDAEIKTDWIGAKFRRTWDENMGPLGMMPAVSEEYFEWIDLLTAAAKARNKFVMIELGAGYGRWGIRGALAAKQKGVREIDIRFVEPEPQHAAWIREAILLNNLKDIKTAVIEAAVSYGGGPVPFAIDWQKEGLTANNWWGQAIVTWECAPETDETYHGKAVHRSSGGFGQIYVDVTTLVEITRDLDSVDLIDADLQGGEKELVLKEIEILNAKVRRIHIGTHSADIEDSIRRMFTDAEWRSCWDFPCGQTVETPFGSVTFQDGIQSWINPRLRADPGKSLSW